MSNIFESLIANPAIYATSMARSRALGGIDTAPGREVLASSPFAPESLTKMVQDDRFKRLVQLTRELGPTNPLVQKELIAFRKQTFGDAMFPMSVPMEAPQTAMQQAQLATEKDQLATSQLQRKNYEQQMLQRELNAPIERAQNEAQTAAIRSRTLGDQLGTVGTAIAAPFQAIGKVGTYLSDQAESAAKINQANASAERDRAMGTYYEQRPTLGTPRPKSYGPLVEAWATLRTEMKTMTDPDEIERSREMLAVLEDEIRGARSQEPRKGQAAPSPVPAVVDINKSAPSEDVGTPAGEPVQVDAVSGAEIPMPMPEQKPVVQPDNLRLDGSPKGPGFFGELARPDGQTSTELSIGVGFDGKETQIPALVPTLTYDERTYLLAGGKPTQAIVDKAVAHAKARMATGQSPFAGPGEQLPAPTSKPIASPVKTKKGKWTFPKLPGSWSDQSGWKSAVAEKQQIAPATTATEPKTVDDFKKQVAILKGQGRLDDAKAYYDQWLGKFSGQ